MPQFLHIFRSAAIVFGKIRQCHFIILISFKEFKAYITQEIVFLISFFPDPHTAEAENIRFLKRIYSIFTDTLPV